MLARQTMDGVHDMGGMHGFGPIERDEATFHAQWEKRVHALMAAAFTRGVGPRNVDAARHAIERISRSPTCGRATTSDGWRRSRQAWLSRACSTKPRSKREPALPAEHETRRRASRSDLPGNDRETGTPARVPAKSDGPAPRFAPGDKVVTRNIHPPGPHPPAALRARQARLHFSRPWHPRLPRHQRPRPRPAAPAALQRAFRGRGVVGRVGREPGSVYLDLWESYLESRKEDA